MKILSENNEVKDLSKDMNGDFNYCVLNTRNKKDVDYFFKPITMIIGCKKAGLKLQIGGDKYINLPYDMSILVGLPGDFLVYPISSLNDRSEFYDVFMFNPISIPSLPKFEEIKIVDQLNSKEITWYIPQLSKNDEFLAVPISDKPDSLCVFIINTERSCYELDIDDYLW